MSTPTTTVKLHVRLNSNASRICTYFSVAFGACTTYREDSPSMKAVRNSVSAKIRTDVQAAILKGALNLPRPLQRAIAGKPVRIDGQELDLGAQVMLRLRQLSGQPGLSATSVNKARAAMLEGHKLVDANPITGIEISDVRIPGPSGELAGRLYRPHEVDAPSELMVFYHGGGWVIGNLDSHDDLCRYLAKQVGIRILSVDYRLAPEAPYPAAVEDAIAAFEYTVNNASELGTDADSILVGGDSAGGNLAAVVAHHASQSGGSKPVLQFLLYPAVDATVRRASRDAFANNLLLTDEDIDWFIDHYCPDVTTRAEPRLSVLLADDLTQMPPAYVITAGFDPLRDEGEAFAEKLTQAGVAVTTRRFPHLIHGFANLRPLGDSFQSALAETAATARSLLKKD